MLVTSIKTLKSYFQSFAEEQNIAFVYGPAKKLIAKSKSSSDFSYPILHLNRPDVSSSDNDMSNYMKSFTCEVVCLQKYSKKGTPEQIDESELDAEDDTFEILLKLEKQMIEDNNDVKIIFNLNTALTEPVSDTFIDYHSGWKMSFKIDFYANSKLQ
jgi:hypothetical protein